MRKRYQGKNRAEADAFYAREAAEAEMTESNQNTPDPTEAEREHCDRVASECAGGRYSITQALIRERAAARAEGERAGYERGKQLNGVERVKLELACKRWSETVAEWKQASGAEASERRSAHVNLTALDARHKRLVGAARRLRAAQRAYMNDRGNDELGYKVATRAREVDALLVDEPAPTAQEQEQGE